MIPVREISIGEQPVSIEDVVDLARRRATVKLSDAAGFRERISRGAELLDRILEEDGVIYGVTTGYGDSCSVDVPADLAWELPIHLTRFHGCGLGKHLSVESSRAVLVARLTSLCRGYSGVSLPLLDLLATYINKNVVPLIPEEGSVGASGDLTPLSYVAAALIGERQVHGEGRVACWIRSDLEHEEMPRNPLRLQDRYSIRCAPHVIGVLAEVLPFFRSQIETELNSSNDAPNIDPDHELVLHGGHFYGGHIAFAMDSMKIAVANIADLLGR